MLSLLAGADSTTRGAATQMAVGLEPGDRAVEALPVVLVGLGELGGQTGELELLLIDLLPSAEQLRGDRLAGSRRSFPDLSLHQESVRTPVWSVKKMCLLISNQRRPGHLFVPRPNPNTYCQLVSPHPACSLREQADLPAWRGGECTVSWRARPSLPFPSLYRFRGSNPSG